MSYPEQSVYLITSTTSTSKLKRVLYNLSHQLKDSEHSMDPTQARELSLVLLDQVHRPSGPPSTTSMSESEVSRENRKSTVSALSLRCLLHLTRKNSEALDWLGLLGDLPERPGLLTIARRPRSFGVSEAAFAMQTAVTLVRTEQTKHYDTLFPQKAAHGFMSSQEVLAWGLGEIIQLVIGNLEASFEPPTANNLDLRSAAIAVLVELCVNTPWHKLPASLATQLTLAIDQNLHSLASPAAQLPLLQALALLIPHAEIGKIADSLGAKLRASVAPTPALFDALSALLKVKNGDLGENFLPLVLKGLEPGGILIAAVRCVAAVAEIDRESAAPVLLGRMLEISCLVEEGPLKAEIVEATAACFFRAQEVSDHHIPRVLVLVEEAGKAPSAKLRAAAGRACGEVLVRLAMIGDISDLLTLWRNLLDDGSVEVVNAALRGLMLTVTNAETSESSRKFLVDNFRSKIRQLAEEIPQEPAMRRERIRADAVRTLGIFGDLEISDQQLVIKALESKIFPTVQAAVWTVEKHAVVFAGKVGNILAEISRKIKDETNARRVLQCGRALLSHREDASLDEALEILTRKFPSAKK